jgi:uncharacterized protein (DUF2147 family)
MTKKYSTTFGFLVIAALLLLSIRPAFAYDKSILGYWKATDTDGKPQSVFRLWEYKGKLVGTILKTFPKPGDKPNPVCNGCRGTLNNKSVIGLNFLWGFVPDPDDGKKWTDGTIVDPSDGKEYHAQVEVADGGKKLKLFAYIKLLVKLGRTNEWSRPTPEDMKGVKR